jgi:elongation factor Ts
MAEITPKLVVQLRSKTGAGMGDCKKALVDADGDIDQAIEILRKKGAASASKRSERAANEGIILAKTNDEGNVGIIVEVNSETDFVARNQAFVDYVETVGNAILNNDIENLDQLMETSSDGTKLIDIHNEILAKFAEKIEVRRFDKIKSDGFLTSYIHTGSKLAVLVEATIKDPSDTQKELLKDIAMQIAAMNPSFITRDVVPQDKVAKEIEIYKDAAIQEGKKPEIAEKIAEGKLNKYFQETCLVEQQFVKDSNLTVADVIKQVGEDVKINKFLRYFLGEEL